MDNISPGGKIVNNNFFLVFAAVVVFGLLQSPFMIGLTKKTLPIAQKFIQMKPETYEIVLYFVHLVIGAIIFYLVNSYAKRSWTGMPVETKAPSKLVNKPKTRAQFVKNTFTV